MTCSEQSSSYVEHLKAIAKDYKKHGNKKASNLQAKLSMGESFTIPGAELQGLDVTVTFVRVHWGIFGLSASHAVVTVHVTN